MGHVQYNSKIPATVVFHDISVTLHRLTRTVTITCQCLVLDEYCDLGTLYPSRQTLPCGGGEAPVAVQLIG